MWNSEQESPTVASSTSQDYDNTFDGVHFTNNTWGVYCDKMANVYIRNSRFEGSTHADVVLAPSAGNSVRRCVSVGSSQFVVSPHHTSVNPTTIQDCRVDAWTGPSAIGFNLRGPLTIFDNVFTNGSNAVVSTPLKNTPWPQTNQVAMFAGNMVDGMPATGAQLQSNTPKNIFGYDLPGTTAIPRTPISPTTRFLKSWWPGVPTQFVSGGACGGSGVDATKCAQSAIDAAAKAGHGAAAYFPAGTYRISAPLVVNPGNYTVLGTGVATLFVWIGTDHADPAMIVVKGNHDGMRLEQFSVQSGPKDLMWDPKVRC